MLNSLGKICSHEYQVSYVEVDRRKLLKKGPFRFTCKFECFHAPDVQHFVDDH